MNKQELERRGCLVSDTLVEAVGLYEEKDICGTEEELVCFLEELLMKNGEKNTYFDFYYGVLTAEEKERVNVSLTREEQNVLNGRIFPGSRGEVFFAYDKALFHIALKLSLGESLFSTFYFAHTKETVWSDYGHRFLVFSEYAPQNSGENTEK